MQSKVLKEELEKKLILHPEAEKELNESYDWHNSNRENSGEQFLNQVNLRLKEIQQKPESRSADEDGIRWTGISKFPYHIFYIFKSPIVWILAIWHTSRKPDDWRKRKGDVE